MYLKQLKLVTNAARPSLSINPAIKKGAYRISCTTQLISKLRLVKGAATLASASERLTPTSAAFRAPQSFAPSPQNPTQYSKDCNFSTNSCFSSGDILAKI